MTTFDYDEETQRWVDDINEGKAEPDSRETTRKLSEKIAQLQSELKDVDERVALLEDILFSPKKTLFSVLPHLFGWLVARFGRRVIERLLRPGDSPLHR